ncbi:uncharacterized protein [Apteryx mantelli]|uniref:Uncharacterized protein n=1 Tax=Apteryx mantelli TaxID=2696672 RepID=A0ABM4E812_9AVES
MPGLPSVSRPGEALHDRKYAFFPKHQGLASERSAAAADPKDIWKHRAIGTAAALGILVAGAVLCCLVILLRRKRKRNLRAAQRSGADASSRLSCRDNWPPTPAPGRPGPNASGCPSPPENRPGRPREGDPPRAGSRPPRPPPPQPSRPPSTAPAPGHQQPTAAAQMQPWAKQQLPPAVPGAVQPPAKPPPRPPRPPACASLLLHWNQLEPVETWGDLGPVVEAANDYIIINIYKLPCCGRRETNFFPLFLAKVNSKADSATCVTFACF